MSNDNSTAWIKPFLTGVLATVTAYHVAPKLFSLTNSTHHDNTHHDNTHHDDNNTGINNNTCKKNASFQKITNRNTLKEQPSSSSTKEELMDSPTLDQRILRKAEAALQNRTSRLIVVVERCTNDHNYSAILRTAEALGIQHVYIIDPQACKSTLKQGQFNLEAKEMGNSNHESKTAEIAQDAKLYRSTGQKIKYSTQAEVKDRAQHHLFAQKALEWLEVKEFQTTKECIDDLRNDGYQIWATDLSQVAVCLTKEGLAEEGIKEDDKQERSIIPQKLAIVFGTEAVGCTAEMLHESDKRVYLPLRGFADSLNLSVATALIIHQLFTIDPTIVGSMPNDERIVIRRKWYSKLASQRLQTKAEKQKRRRLVSQIGECTKLEWRMNNPNSGEQPLQPHQLEKVKKLSLLRSELKEIDDVLQEKSLKVIEDLVLNPPQPITDMRRADEHRTTYVGKNTKKSYSETWSNMAATGYFRSEQGTTSTFFRERLNK